MTQLYPPSGTITLTLTEPAALAWLIKMSSYQPPATSVTFQAAVGSGSQQTLTPISPAAVSIYADIYTWSTTAALGKVGLSPWGTPTGWTDTGAWWIGPDTSASSSDPPGEWLLRKWILCTTSDTYTVNLAADAQATLYIDDTQIAQATGYTSATTATVSLTKGRHLVTVDVVNYGTAPNPTGCLLSIADSLCNIIENGNDGHWQTTGYINHAWSYSSGAPLFTDTWYVINTPSSENVSITLTLTGNGTLTPQVNNLWWYSVAPWKWDESGMYDQAANAMLPINVVNVGSA